MLLPTLSTALLALASLASAKPVTASSTLAAAAASPSAATVPAAPGFKWLYTAMVLCPANVMPNVTSPQGVRKAIPIVGGNVTMADGSEWTIRDLGADWGVRPSHPPLLLFESSRAELTAPPRLPLLLFPLARPARPDLLSPPTSSRQTVDPRTGIFTADTRYNAYNSKGDDLFFQTSGPGQAAGGLHLRAKIETGSEEYYWLNHVVGASLFRALALALENLTSGSTLCARSGWHPQQPRRRRQERLDAAHRCL